MDRIFRHRLSRRARPSVVFPIVVVAAIACSAKARAADGPMAGAGGAFTGQIRLKGDPPVLPELNTPIPGLIIPDESVLVDSESRGIANVFVYLQRTPPGVKVPDPSQKAVTVVMAGSRYVPHAFGVRAGQPIQFLNADTEARCFQMRLVRNPGQQRLVAPGKSETITHQKGERIPVPTADSFLPFMRCWHIVLEHPWFAVTDAEGRFTIEGVPPGHHEFVIWQERVGFLEKKCVVEIAPGKTITVDLEYKSDKLIPLAPLGVPAEAIYRAGLFDLRQAGDGRDLIAGKRILSYELSRRLEKLNQICHLTDGQRQKLELAGIGEIEYLLEEVNTLRAEVLKLKSRDDVDPDLIRDKIPALRARLSTGLFGPDSMFGKTLHNALTLEQKAQIGAARGMYKRSEDD